MANLDDLERRLAEAERKLAQWEQFRKNRRQEPYFEVELLVHLAQHDKHIENIFECLKHLRELWRGCEGWEDLNREARAQLAEVYYHVFPERLEKDNRVDKQLSRIFPWPWSKDKPK
jgi:hypothetical protein